MSRNEYERQFSRRNQDPASFGRIVSPDGPLPEPRWYDMSAWKIGEWGSLASIVGLGLWLVEKTWLKPPKLRIHSTGEMGRRRK